MLFNVLDVSVFSLLFLLGGLMKQQVEAVEIRISAESGRNLLLLKDHHLVHSLGKLLQQTSFFKTQQDFSHVGWGAYRGFVHAPRLSTLAFAIALPERQPQASARGPGAHAWG
jgi:hypothetical protein